MSIYLHLALPGSATSLMASPQRPPIFLLAADDDRSCSFCGACPFLGNMSPYARDHVLKRRVFMDIWNDDMWFQCTHTTSAILCRTCNFLVMSDRNLQFPGAGVYEPGFTPASELHVADAYSDS